VGRPGSADLDELEPPDPDEPEFEAPLFSFEERLQRESAKPSSSRTRRFFIICSFYSKAEGKSIL
jgi:hypothetical protein